MLRQFQCDRCLKCSTYHKYLPLGWLMFPLNNTVWRDPTKESGREQVQDEVYICNACVGELVESKLREQGYDIKKVGYFYSRSKR